MVSIKLNNKFYFDKSLLFLLFYNEDDAHLCGGVLYFINNNFLELKRTLFLILEKINFCIKSNNIC